MSAFFGVLSILILTWVVVRPILARYYEDRGGHRRHYTADALAAMDREDAWLKERRQR